MSFYNLFVASIRSVDQQRVCQRRWRRLATEYAGVDELPDNLQSGTKDGKKSTFLDSGQSMLSNDELSKNNSPPEVVNILHINNKHMT